MFVEYLNLKDKFEDRFVSQMLYAMYADGEVSEGLNFFYGETATNPLFNNGCCNGGCFRDYPVAILFRLRNCYVQNVHLQ